MKAMKLDVERSGTISTFGAEGPEIRFPDPDELSSALSQDREWCDVIKGDKRRRIRFHDYHEVYSIPGLYEEIFYERLRCCSPQRVTGLLLDVLDEYEANARDLKILDLGAGNGMVGEELRTHRVKGVVGVDILLEAKRATLRDRPGVYDAYFVADFTDLPYEEEKRLRDMRLNCLTSVAALGFGDIPPKAFSTALDLLETPGWVAFNIKEDFLRERDDTGFCRLIRQLMREEILQVQSYFRYRHRFSVAGTPLYYVGMVARKRRPIPESILEFTG